MKAKIISIGDELLIGQVIDTNSAWIAGELNTLGIMVTEIQSIGDKRSVIIRAIQESFSHADLLILTGGLGPTHDDLTAEALAEVYDSPLTFHEKSYEHLKRVAKRLQRPLTEAHKKQCFLPEKATVLPNKMGMSPGMWFEENGKILVSVPGVPFEMKYLFRHQILQKLSNYLDGTILLHRTILTVGEGESKLADILDDFLKSLPDYINLAFLPDLNQVRIRLSMQAKKAQRAKKELNAYTKELVTQIPDLVYGFDEDTLEATVGRLLRQKGLTISTAESCTGGYISHRITSIQGSSEYYVGSVIAYSNKVKQEILKVRTKTLKQHGAVSEETVEEMALGVRKLTGSDLAVSTSGIAGPTGGTKEKPVGMICLGIASQDRVASETIYLGKNRLKNIEFTAIHALNMIRKFLTQR